MSNSIAKKIFASAVAASTVLGSFGSLALVAKASPHGAGSVIQAAGDPTVWFITNDGVRRPFTSGGALQSYGFLSFSQVVTANTDDLALPIGAFIPPADGTIFCATETKGNDVKGECSVITGGQKASVTSAAVFAGQGYSFSNAYYGDSSFLTKTANIDNAAGAHLMGTLINKSGTVYLVGPSGGLLGIPDIATFNSWGYSFAKVVAGNAADTGSQTGVMASRIPGQLSPTGLVTPPTAGSVTIASASNTPASATVPKGSTNVSFLKFTVSNSSSSATTLTGITVNRSGAGSPSDISNVYLFNGDERLTTGRSINTSTNQAVFVGLNVSVPGNGSLTLTVLGDISSTAGAGNVHILSVSAATLSSGTASGAASGNAMTLATASSGTIAVTKTGSITNPKVGETNVKVAEFQLAAGSAEDLTLKRLALFYNGSLSKTAISNFKLMQAGQTIATASNIDSRDHVTFVMNFNLDRGNSRTFQVMADIGGGARALDTVKFYVEEDIDLFAQGRTFGFGAIVYKDSGDTVAGTYGGASCTSSAGECSYSAIEGGRVTINFQGPAATDVSPNAQDVELYRFNLSSQNNIEIRRVVLNLLSNGDVGSDADGLLTAATSANFRDIKIWDTSSNTVVAGPLDVSIAGSDVTQDLTFTDVWNIVAGSSRTYKVTADIANYVPDASETIKVSMNAFGASDIKNLDNNQFLTPSADIVPNSVIGGNIHNVRAAALVTGIAGTPAIQSFINGKQSADMAGYNFTAGIGRDITITQVKVTATGADHCATETNCVLALRLYDGATQVGQAQSLSTDTATFSSLNVLVAKGTTKTLTLKIDISNTASDGGGNDTIHFDIASATDVVAQDQDGNSVVPTGTATGPTMSIAQSGTLTVLNAGTEIDVTDNHIIIAGSSNQTIAKYRFTASNEDVRVTQLGISVGAGAKEEVTMIRLYDGATEIGSGVVPNSSGVSAFVAAGGSQLFTVPKNGSKTITVSVNTNSVKGTGAASGTSVQATLVADGTSTFEAIGVDSGTTLTDPSGLGLAATGTALLRNTKPTFVLQPLVGNLTTGTKVIYKFTVTADAHDQVSLKQLWFTVTSTATATVDTIAIREAGTVTNIGITGTSPVGSGTGKLAFTSEQIINAGTSKTYEVLETITAAAAGTSISTAMANADASTDSTGWASTQGAAPGLFVDDADNSVADGTVANFLWSDNAAVSHIDTPSAGGAPFSGSADWNNGWLVRTPTDTQTLTVPN